jgi:phosphoglycolate phosphatase
MSRKGIIFDLDGTLWDSCKEVTDSWNIALSQCEDIDFKLKVEDIKNVMGKTNDEIAKIFFRDLSEERALEIMKLCCEVEDKYLEKHGGILYPKVEETLIELNKYYDLYIVSNCQEGYIETFLKLNNLSKYFKDFESAGKTSLSKGENIKLVVKRNNIEEAIYVGDTQGDYNATKIAKLPFIYAKYGFGTINEEIEKIEKLEDIVKVAERVFEKN